MKYMENTFFVLSLLVMWIIALWEYTIGGDARKLLYLMGYALVFMFLMFSISRTISSFTAWLKFRADHAERYGKLVDARKRARKKGK